MLLMIVFWILALLLAVAATVLVLLPLRRDVRHDEQDLVALNRRVFRERLAELEKDHADARIDAATLAELRTELERNLLLLEPEAAPARENRATSRRAALVAFVSVPLLAAAFYYTAVAPQSLGEWWEVRSEMGPVVDRLLRDGEVSHAEEERLGMANRIRLLQDRLQKNPGDDRGWLMLGKSYLWLGQVQPATVALEHAWRLQPENPEYAVGMALALIFGNERQLDAQSRRLLDGVLADYPEYEDALRIYGVFAYQSGDFVTAATMLQRLLALPNPSRADPAMLQEMQAMMADAKARLGRPAQAEQKAAVAGPVIRVRVKIDRTLAGKFSPDDNLYVFARALQGPPMPLAVAKRRAGDLPLTLELDDSQSMMAERPLSSVPEVAVSARISRHGDPQPQPGDLEAIAVPVRQSGGLQQVELLIRNVR
ncbi:MAG: cytochrome c-type biosis protein CcmI [Moraxellaceae bacterium]|jgi:cytochrome c-type biogenesis protein CcmH|nr:cytochrome c-type biosis protein CcmI [Moraxellaceae bacterium]